LIGGYVDALLLLATNVKIKNFYSAAIDNSAEIGTTICDWS
jgi:hypothetical protein